MQDPLPDLQNSFDPRDVALYRVGVEDIKFPIKVVSKGGRPVATQAVVDLYVNLPPDRKGVNMSRFMEVLMQYHDRTISVRVLESMVRDLKDRMQSEDAFIRFNFVYFLKKSSPVTAKIAVAGYPISLVGYINSDGDFFRAIRLYVFVQTLCPCSKEISEYGAHNQRCKVRVDLYPTSRDYLQWFEDIIPQIEQQGSVPLFPLLKRADEKYVTEHAYDNPKFVEDVARDVGLLFKRQIEQHLLTGVDVKVVSQESIHNHQAVAYFKCGKPSFGV